MGLFQDIEYLVVSHERCSNIIAIPELNFFERTKTDLFTFFFIGTLNKQTEFDL